LSVYPACDGNPGQREARVIAYHPFLNNGVAKSISLFDRLQVNGKGGPGIFFYPDQGRGSRNGYAVFSVEPDYTRGDKSAEGSVLVCHNINCIERVPVTGIVAQDNRVTFTFFRFTLFVTVTGNDALKKEGVLYPV